MICINVDRSLAVLKEIVKGCEFGAMVLAFHRIVAPALKSWYCLDQGCDFGAMALKIAPFPEL